MKAKKPRKRSIIALVVSAVVLVALFFFPKKIPDHMGSLTEWFMSEPPEIAGQDGLTPPGDSPSADAEATGPDLSKMAKPQQQLEETKDIVLDGFIRRVKYMPKPDSEKNAAGDQFQYKYELEVRVEKDQKPELKKIGLTLTDEKILAPFFEKQSAAQEQMGERFFVRGYLHKSKDSGDWLTWMMDVKAVKKWKYADPCKSYSSPNHLAAVETLPVEIRDNKTVIDAVQKICPNFMAEMDSRRDWLLVDSENAKALTFFFGCDKDLDGQAEGFGIFVNGKEITKAEQSIDTVMPDQSERAACWIEDMDRYFSKQTSK